MSPLTPHQFVVAGDGPYVSAKDRTDCPFDSEAVPLIGLSLRPATLASDN